MPFDYLSSFARSSIFLLAMAGTATATPVEFTILPYSFPNSTYTTESGINDSGFVVGSYNYGPPGYYGYPLNGFEECPQGQFIAIKYPGAMSTAPTAINDSGEIVGDFQVGGYNHAFLDNHGTFTKIDPPGSTASFATGINSSGEVTLYSDNLGSIIDDQSVFTPFSVPGLTHVMATGINDSGEIVGYGSNGSEHAVSFIDDHNTITLLELGADGTEVYGINNDGDVVGFSYDAAAAEHAFVDVNGAIYTIDAPNFESTLSPNGINNQIHIVGTDQPFGGPCSRETCGFLAYPDSPLPAEVPNHDAETIPSDVPEPGPFALVALGLIAIAACLRNSRV